MCYAVVGLVVKLKKNAICLITASCIVMVNQLVKFSFKFCSSDKVKSLYISAMRNMVS